MYICGYITWRVLVNQIWLAPRWNILLLIMKNLWRHTSLQINRKIGSSKKNILFCRGAGRADLQYTTATGAFTVPSSSATSALALEFHTLAGRFSHRAPSVRMYLFHYIYVSFVYCRLQMFGFPMADSCDENALWQVRTRRDFNHWLVNSQFDW